MQPIQQRRKTTVLTLVWYQSFYITLHYITRRRSKTLSLCKNDVQSLDVSVSKLDCSGLIIIDPRVNSKSIKSEIVLLLPQQVLRGICYVSGEFRMCPSVKIADINMSQGSVVTHLRCGGIFIGCFIANFLESVSVKEFLKSVNIW